MNLSVRQTLLLLAVTGLALTASGFILEYGFGVIPCHMCWWQRYPHWAIAVLGLLGASHPRLGRPALAAIVLASLTGLGLAGWMFAAQHGWLPFPASCNSATMPAYAAADDLLAAMSATKVVPCDKETFTLFGLSLAGWNIPAMLAIVAVSASRLFFRPIKG